jgi:hypothetical protein
MFETIGLCIEILVALVILGWIVAYFGSTYLSTSAAGKTAVSAIDTSEQLAAYGALTAVRCMAPVSADPQAVTACEYLRGVVTAWKLPAASATTPATPAKSA